MELRRVEPLFVLLTLLALVACVSRFVPAAAQAPAHRSTPEPTPTSLPTSTPEPVPTLVTEPAAMPISSIALVRPGAASPTLVLTGTVDCLTQARAWLSSSKLLYVQESPYEG
jgi:hypothetical protein